MDSVSTGPASTGSASTGSASTGSASTGSASVETADGTTTTIDPETTSDGTTTGSDTGSESTASGPVCGDGVVEGDEECDDENDDNTDACSNACLDAFCGDGFVQTGVEECDDMNETPSDGCEDNCMLSSGVAQLSTSWYSTCATFFSGAVRCWGFGYGGQLGTVSNEDLGDDEPASAFGDVDVGALIAQVAPGANFACARTVEGAARCWGDNLDGQLGLGHVNRIGDDEAPSAALDVNVGGTILDISSGRSHTCVVLVGGSVRCWGDSNAGQLGYGNTDNIGDDEDPATAGDISLGGTAVAVEVGWEHSCALLDDGTVRCWGAGGSGRLGYGNTDTIGDNETPDAVGTVNVGGTVVQLAAGQSHTCALLDSGNVRCWGSGGSGRLGYGNTATIGDNETPASAGNVPVGGTVQQIAAGQHHTCALLDTGAVRCWGTGSSGQLGYGDTASIGDDEAPSAAGDVAVGAIVLGVTAGNVHTCVRTAANAVRCWGSGTYGQLGHGNDLAIGDDETPASAGNVPLF